MTYYKGVWTFRTEQIGKVTYRWYADFDPFGEFRDKHPRVRGQGTAQPDPRAALKAAVRYADQADKDRSRGGQTRRKGL